MKDTKRLVLAAVLIAMVILLGMTPFGMIPLGFINLTIVHIPVIIAALTTDYKTSIFTGLAFGIVSILAAFGMSLAAQSSLAAMILAYSPLAVIVMSVVPRVLIPVVARSVYKLIKGLAGHGEKGDSPVALTVAAVCGSLTNTVCYLGLMGLFFYIFGIWGNFTKILSVTMLVAASCEAAAAAIIATPVALAVNKRKY